MFGNKNLKINTTTKVIKYIDVNQLLNELKIVPKDELQKKLIIMCKFFKSIIDNNEDVIQLLTFDSLINILTELEGKIRCFKALNILIIRGLIELSEINQTKLEILNRYIDTDKMVTIIELFSDQKRKYNLIKTYKKPHELTQDQLKNNKYAEWVCDEITTELQPYTSRKPHIYDPKNNSKPIHNITPPRERETTNINKTKEIVKFSYKKLCEKIKNNDINDLVICNYDKNLIDTDFYDIFSMSQEEFYKLPKWKQIQIKKDKHLF